MMIIIELMYCNMEVMMLRSSFCLHKDDGCCDTVAHVTYGCVVLLTQVVIECREQQEKVSVNSMHIVSVHGFGVRLARLYCVM